MDSYIHKIYFFGPGGSEFDETIGDHVYQSIHFELVTLNYSKNIHVTSGYMIYNLPPPDPNNFVSGIRVTDLDRARWINDGIDIIALQNTNIAKIEEIVQQANDSQQTP